MKREEKIEVLKSYVNVNGYIYEHDIEAIADELEQQPQEKEETVYDQLSRLHDFCCEKMENISQKMIDIDSLHLGRYRTYKVIVDWIKKQETPQQPDKDILDCISQFDDTETLENKGRYFEVIQKDIRKYLCPPE